MVAVVYYFFGLRINGLQNTKEPEIEPWFSIPKEELLYTERGDGVRRCQFLRKSAS